MKKIYLIFYSFTFLTTALFSAPTCSDNKTAEELAAQIEGVGITITNPQITYGDHTQVGTFTGGTAAGLEIDEGILLTTMTVDDSCRVNSSGATSVNHNSDDYDSDLLGIDSSAHYNTIVFEFDVTLDENTRLLLVDYQFGAEEYNEYVGTIYNDAFGFFISGGDLNQTYNIARVIDNSTYVTINDIDNYDTVTVNNVNNGTQGSAYVEERDKDVVPVYTNTAFYIDNDQNNDGDNSTSSPVEVEYDGLTVTLHATLDNLTPGETYHFKMAIADTSDPNLNTGVFVNKISGLREPSICYDYAYKQNGIYLTKGYDADTGPYIDADVTANDPENPVEVSMYFRNTKDSEITASDVTISVLDINTTQATYHPESVWVTEPGEISKTKIDDADINVSDSYIRDIPIDSFDAFEYFYTYFSLDPKVTSLVLPIVARIDYNLTIPLSETESVTIHRSSMIDSDVPICGGGSNEYKPVYGAFNIIENSLYTDDTHYYYNINTQVTGRVGDLSVVSVDMNTSENPDLHNLKPISTIVAVDMLDLKSFHYTGASCSETSNALTERVWLIFDNESKTFLNVDGSQFNQVAREQVAFRVAYNYMDDNQSVPYIGKENNGDLTILNWNSEWQGETCTQDMVTNGKGNDNQVSSYCNFTGGSPDELATCMECIFGAHTKFVCSRDNFAIRPEAFLETLYDQDDTNASQPLIKISDNGVTSPSTTRIDIAAGYKYRLEVNATNHADNTASPGYTIHLNALPGTKAGYMWSPVSTITGCEDTTDHTFTVKMANGREDMNSTLNQVGEYTLQLEDTVWTTVDSVEQSHHSLDYFLSGPDCTLDSAVVAKESQSDSLTGCNISSAHINQDNNIQYIDLNVTAHPYKFNVVNNVKLGMANGGVGITPPTTFKPFVYMANISQDENMSVHLNTRVTAKGKNDVTLTNYVNGCFAKPINLTIQKTATSNPALVYSFRVHKKDENNTILSGSDFNGSIPANNVNANVAFNLAKDYFMPDTTTAVDYNGTAFILTNLNYNREVNVTTNPEDINFTTIIADDNATLFNADLVTNKYAEGNTSVNQRVLYYYGRTIAPNITVVCNQNTCRTGISATNDNNIAELVSYVIFCQGGSCNTSILPAGSTQAVDARWFTNTNHDRVDGGWLPLGTDGDIGTITEISNSGNVYEVPGTRHITLQNYETEVVIEYNGPLPYDAFMQMQSSPWLINDPNDGNATTNKFTIQFTGNGGWSGKYEDNTTTKTNFSTKTNRRIMW